MIASVRVALDALRHNAKLLRDVVGAKHAAFVVKGNGYGHGIVETALAVEPFATRICVYSLEEGVALRDGGITAPVLVMGPIPPAGLPQALACDLELALWDAKSFVRDLAGAARARQTRARVHVKVNTGLNRLGFEPHELADAVEEYLHVGEIEVEGIFSHLASAEEIDSPYTTHQLETFDRSLAAVKPLLEARALAPIRHIAASAAAMLWPQARLDMARFGIALYGLWPSLQTREAMQPKPLDLRPALSYESKLVVLRSIPAGASVGYGGTFHAPKDMRIGVVPVGYADGIPRLLSNRGAFIVDGTLCPIVGRIAMNMTEIDVTQASGARPGSRVTLIGRDGGAVVGADDWAAWAQTINYEIVTRIPSEIPREYVAEKDVPSA